MSTICLSTTVYDSAGTGHGLLGRSLWVVHWCNECRAKVPTAELVAHARVHGEPTRWEPPEEGDAIE